MDDPVAIMRMVERITAVLIGGLAIYLGYRLFFHLPFSRDHEGQLELPGVKVVLSRVGPGVFFAAFGSLVLLYSFTNPVIITPDKKMLAASIDEADDSSSKAMEGKSFIGISGVPSAQQRSKALTTIEVLNCAQKMLEGEVSRPDFEDQIAIAIREAKRVLILSVWNEDDWGPADQFGMTGPTADSPFQLRSIFNATYEDCPQ
jgi:hypothetical protein